MSWSSFWYYLCASPLEVRTVSLVLFLQAFALYCLCYTVYPLSGMLITCSARLCIANTEPLQSTVSVDCTLPLSGAPHKRYTRQDLLGIGAASPSSAGPPSPLLIVCLRHLGIADDLPRKPRRSRRGGRIEPRKIKVRISGSDRPPRGPTIDYTPTEPEPHHHPSRPDSITATVTAAKSRSLSYSDHQRQGNLIRVNPTQKDDRLVASVFNLSQLLLQKNEQKLWNLSKMKVLPFCF